MLLKSAKVWFTLPILLTLFTACGDDNGISPEDWRTELDVPLTVGSRWTFLAIRNETSLPADTSHVTSIITGTRKIDGLTYSCMIDSSHTGEISPDTTYLHQEGGIMHVYPGFPSETPEDPFEVWFQQILTESLPWKVVDTGASPGDSWTEFEATQTFVGEGGQQFEVSVRMTIERLEDAPVSVPAGHWTAYRAAMHQRTTITRGAQQSERVGDQIISLADDIGVIMQDWRETSTFPEDPALFEEKRILEEFTLQ